MVRKARAPKTEAPGRRTAVILRQNAIPFLLALRDEATWCTPSHVARKMGAQTRWMQTTVSRLQAAGLIDVRDTGRRGDRATREVNLTKRGARLCKALDSVVEELEPNGG